MQVPIPAEDLKNEIARLAMPLLVERLGGVVELTEAELDAFGERHGGIKKVGVRMDRIPGGIRLTIVHVERPPEN